MKPIPFLTLAASALLAGACGKSQKMEYPAAPADSTTYEVFGLTVNDFYRPLENDTSAETLAWVEAENKVTQDYLSHIPFRGAIHQRLDSLFRYSRQGMPSKENDGKYYFYANDGSKNQSVLYRMDSIGDQPVVFLDPNTLSDDGTVALTGVYQSKNGKYTAYTISRSGSDWTEIYVMDTDTGELLDDHIEWAKFTGAAWAGDGFYYSAYERPEAGKEFSNANEFHKVYYHKLGTPQSEDRVAFEDPRAPLHFHAVGTSNDQNYIVISVGGQGLGDGILVKDLRNPAAKWVTIEPSQDYLTDVVDVIDGKVYMRTSKGAPRNRLVAVDLNKPDVWVDVLPEDAGGGVLSSVQFAGKDHLIAVYDRDASDHAALFTRDGRKVRDIELPTYGSVGFSTSDDSDEVFYSFNSFTYPTNIYSYNIADGTSELFHATEVDGVNPNDYVTEQVFYPSADGTKVPMFLTYKKGLERNGDNPVYIYGYGGFNIALHPGFSAQRILWLENGGIYAQTNLRGGSEYGEEWHMAGTKQQKLNVFNDFIAAAEYLVKENWTNPGLITIEGGSNGGLLVGATVNMRPDLFKVAIPRVGVMDMMRYHLFTIGWNWASDYGTADDSKEMAEYLLGYSPLHNISNDGTPYPAIMVTTADHDDRVVPAHSFKYAATLQAADTGDAPKLIRIDSKAGHGAGKPVAKVIDEYADIYSFIFYNLGRTPSTGK